MAGGAPAVEPVVGEPAAVADLGDRRLLLVADVHAGIEVGLRYERGVELDSRADERRERLCGLIAETDADRLVILGDLAHRIAAPEGDERDGARRADPGGHGSRPDDARRRGEPRRRGR